MGNGWTGNGEWRMGDRIESSGWARSTACRSSYLDSYIQIGVSILFIYSIPKPFGHPYPIPYPFIYSFTHSFTHSSTHLLIFVHASHDVYNSWTYRTSSIRVMIHRFIILSMFIGHRGAETQRTDEHGKKIYENKIKKAIINANKAIASVRAKPMIQ